MATLEKGPVTERSFAQEVGHRVILRLVGMDERPLEHTGALKLNRLLHEEKKNPFSQVSFSDGKYYVEFAVPTDSDESALELAVEETDTALSSGNLFADLEAAWVVPKEAPAIDWLTSKVLEEMPQVTADARSIYAQHHDQLIEAQLNHVLYEVA